MSGNDRNYKEKVDKARDRLDSGKVQDAFQEGFNEVMEPVEELDAFEDDESES